MLVFTRRTQQNSNAGDLQKHYHTKTKDYPEDSLIHTTNVILPNLTLDTMAPNALPKMNVTVFSLLSV